MGRRSVLDIEDVQIISVAEDDTIVERLDDHEFTEDEDPTDRLDEFEIGITVIVRRRSDIETLRKMCDDQVDLVISSEFG